MTELFSNLIRIFVVAGGLGLSTWVLNRRLLAFFDERPQLKFRRQLIQLGGVLLAILLVILLMPFPNEVRGDLLSLFGLIVSATIALSSTTLIGNVMAGIMLKTIGSCRPGDYITVGDHFGRISEMDLLHTEIQTEQRDLTTLPNLFLVTNPVRVMRNSGTLLSVELSLGYDVSRDKIEPLLIEAATVTGLESPFVQIRRLGDFSVTYAVVGLLKEVNQLLAKRRELRARTIDALHAANIEIVSPSFMNTRNFANHESFISEVDVRQAETSSSTSPDALVFDKAEKAESVEKMREKLKELQNRLKDCQKVVAETKEGKSQATVLMECEPLESRIERLRALIEKRETKISEEL